MRRVDSDTPRPAEQLASALRGAEGELDDFVRVRMERNIVAAWRARGAAAVPLLNVRKARRSPSRSAWVASVAVSAAAGVLLGIYAWRSREPLPSVSAPDLVAHFELVIDDGAVQSGYIAEGQVLESGKHGHIEVGLAQSRVDISPESRVRFERLSRDELRLALVTGRVEVAFHPEHKGQEHMSIETRAARVMVVGTRFDVSADAFGNTSVSVSEGVVQVVPRRGGQPRFLRAGERMTVPAEAQGDKAQAVREAIEQRLAGKSPAPAEEPSDAVVDAPQASDGLSALGSEHEAKHLTGLDEQAPERRLEAARKLLLQGKHGLARERLQKLAKSSLPTGDRVEALMLIAESFTAQGQIARATDAYREAVHVAPRHPAGHNALFALARLLERYTDDRSAAGAAYREYLQKAPSGALAPQAREALCRLGDAASCGE